MKNSGWTAVKHDVYIDYDLENWPLEIKTNSSLGSNDEVQIRFFSGQNKEVGRFKLAFSSNIRYIIGMCRRSHEWNDLKTEIPSELDKEWRITLERYDRPRIVLHCNEVEVLKYVIRSGTCSVKSWDTYWNRKAKKIHFTTSDTATNFHTSLSLHSRIIKGNVSLVQ